MASGASVPREGVTEALGGTQELTRFAKSQHGLRDIYPPYVRAPTWGSCSLEQRDSTLRERAREFGTAARAFGWVLDGRLGKRHDGPQSVGTHWTLHAGKGKGAPWLRRRTWR